MLDIVRRTSISIDTWQTWLTGFRNWKASKPGSAGFNKIIFAPFMNCKNFLRSLYFVLKSLDSSRKDEKADVKALAKAILALIEDNLEHFA